MGSPHEQLSHELLAAHDPQPGLCLGHDVGGRDREKPDELLTGLLADVVEPFRALLQDAGDGGVVLGRGEVRCKVWQTAGVGEEELDRSC